MRVRVSGSHPFVAAVVWFARSVFSRGSRFLVVKSLFIRCVHLCNCKCFGCGPVHVGSSGPRRGACVWPHGKGVQVLLLFALLFLVVHRFSQFCFSAVFVCVVLVGVSCVALVFIGVWLFARAFFLGTSFGLFFLICFTAVGGCSFFVGVTFALNNNHVLDVSLLFFFLGRVFWGMVRARCFVGDLS